jgi:hypothetical protein
MFVNTDEGNGGLFGQFFEFILTKSAWQHVG